MAADKNYACLNSIFAILTIPEDFHDLALVFLDETSHRFVEGSQEPLTDMDGDNPGGTILWRQGI